MAFRVCPAARGRRGFTIAELLVAAAVLTLILSILSQAFVEGLETFRRLKAAGDLAEELRQASLDLRRQVLMANEATTAFIGETLLTGTPDRAAASDLKARYLVICADAENLESRLREVEEQTSNPAARRLLGRTLDALHGVKLSAATMIKLLDLLAPPPQPD